MKKGDEIRIVSSARAVSPTELISSITELESWGLKVTLGANIHKIFYQFAGTYNDRSSDIQQAISDPMVKAVLFARGGYGSVQVVDFIDYSHLIHNPKWFIGYSDITVFHSHLSSLNIPSIHATMPINFPNNTQKALLSLKKLLFGGENRISTSKHVNNRPGKANGKLIGGNLSILYSLLGSKSDVNTDGKILFIEDLDEYLYHIDRMMMNLKRNGKFDKLKGLIVGGMTKMNDNVVPFGYSAEEIIINATKDYDFPIVFGFPAGHLDDNRALFMGIDTQINVNNNGCVFVQNNKST